MRKSRLGWPCTGRSTFSSRPVMGTRQCLGMAESRGGGGGRGTGWATAGLSCAGVRKEKCEVQNRQPDRRPKPCHVFEKLMRTQPSSRNCPPRQNAPRPACAPPIQHPAIPGRAPVHPFTAWSTYIVICAFSHSHTSSTCRFNDLCLMAG